MKPQRSIIRWVTILIPLTVLLLAFMLALPSASAQGENTSTPTPINTQTPTPYSGGLKLTSLDFHQYGGGYSATVTTYSNVSVGTDANDIYLSGKLVGQAGPDGDFKDLQGGYTIKNTSTSTLKVYLYGYSEASGNLTVNNFGFTDPDQYYNEGVPDPQGYFGFGPVTWSFYYMIPAGQSRTFLAEVGKNWARMTPNGAYSYYSSWHISVFPSDSAFTPTPSPTITPTNTPSPTVDPLSIRYSGGNKTLNNSSAIETDKTISGLIDTQLCCGDPINTHTGVSSFTLADLSFSTSAGDLVFQRSYSSGAVDTAGVLGYGWIHNHDAKLIFPTNPGGKDGYVLFQSVLGNQYLFKIESDGTFTPDHGVIASLTKSTSTPITYTLTDSQQSIFQFNQNGVLTLRKNALGHEIDYNYDSNGKLIKISADNGTHFLQIGYDPQGRINSVKDYANREVIYSYDNTSGDLSSFTDVLGRTWTYAYNADHHLTLAQDPNGKDIVKTDYDSQGRAWRQFGPDINGDGQDELLIELTYNANGNTTVQPGLDDPNTHTYDERGTITNQTNSAVGNQSRHYDANFRPDVITDSLGNTTNLTWSDDGVNLTHIEDALHNPTDIDYNDYNNPTKVVDSVGNQILYLYEDANFPTLPTQTKVLDPSDNLISKTSYEYYPPSSEIWAGKIKFLTDALEHQTYFEYALTDTGYKETVHIAYGTPSVQTIVNEYDNLGRLVKTTNPAGLITLNEYDDAGHLTKTTNPAGLITLNEYDDAGRLITTTRNYDLNRPQNDQNKYNLVTEYRYDNQGNQIAVIDTYGIITRTYYDIENRPVTVVQNLTGRTIETTSPPNRGTGITDENIRTDTVYDPAGNVFQTIDPAGIVTQTYYDAANRPSFTVQNFVDPGIYDPTYPDQNIRTEYFYDANGNVIATKDTLGVITRTYYDGLNRPKTVVQNLTGQDITETNAPGRGTSSNIRNDTYYDANGNTIAIIDPKGIITRTYYDSLNQSVAVVKNLVGKSYADSTLPDPAQDCGTEANICSFTYYDQAGNTIASVDPTGVVTRTYYQSSRPYTTVQNLIGDIYANTPPERGSGQSGENIRWDTRRSMTMMKLGN